MKKHLKFNEHSHGLAQVNTNSTLMIEFPWQGPYISLICQNLTGKSCECFIAETTLKLWGIREKNLHNTLYVNNLRWQLRTFALEKHLPRGEHVALPQTTTIFSPHKMQNNLPHSTHPNPGDHPNSHRQKRLIFKFRFGSNPILSTLVHMSRAWQQGRNVMARGPNYSTWMENLWKM